MHMIFPLAIRASEILGVDEDLRPLWREIKEKLVPIPERAGRRARGVYGAFVYGGSGEIEPVGSDPEFKRRFLGFNRLGSFIDDPGIGGARIFRNRLRLPERPGAIDAEHIAGLSAGIHSSLSSDPEMPGGEPILRAFNSWPKDWDAAFTLLARGAFEVTSAIQGGKVAFVEMHSIAGSDCRMRNPCGEADVTLSRDGEKAETLRGSLLKFSTGKGERIVLVPAGTTPRQQRRGILGPTPGN